MVQGKIDEQRVDRRNFYVLYCMQTEKPSDMLSVFPLAFDEELNQKAELSDFQLYTVAKDLGYFQNPLN